MMRIKVLVFDANSSLGNVGREIIKLDGSSVFISIDLIEEFATTIKDFGGDGIGFLGEIFWGGEVTKDEEIETNKKGDANKEREGREKRVASFGPFFA